VPGCPAVARAPDATACGPCDQNVAVRWVNSELGDATDPGESGIRSWPDRRPTGARAKEVPPPLDQRRSYEGAIDNVELPEEAVKTLLADVPSAKTSKRRHGLGPTPESGEILPIDDVLVLGRAKNELANAIDNRGSKVSIRSFGELPQFWIAFNPLPVPRKSLERGPNLGILRWSEGLVKAGAANFADDHLFLRPVAEGVNQVSLATIRDFGHHYRF
jgi:hypothetical protein